MARRGHTAGLRGRRVAACALACALATALAAVPGCGGSGGASASAPTSASAAQATSAATQGGSSSAQAAKASDSTASAPSGSAFEQPSSILEPKEAPDSGGEPSIDASNAAAGYVVAQAASDARLKFQVRCGEQTYNYDLPGDGTQAVYPVNMGDGAYTFRIMQNTSGSNYVELCSQSADVTLDSEFAPFLVSNVFCRYDGKSACTAKARELTANAADYAQVVQAVCEFVVENVRYDNAKAAQLANESGYVPNPDETLSSQSGICFDYAALSAAMLRAMGVPTKIVTGYVGADQVYHAWIMVYIDGTWETAFFRVSPNTWSRCDVTFASTGSSEYVGDASSYTDRYTY